MQDPQYEAERTESGLVVVKNEGLFVPEAVGKQVQERQPEEIIIGKIDRAQRRRIARAAKKQSETFMFGPSRTAVRAAERKAKVAASKQSRRQVQHEGRVTR